MAMNPDTEEDIDEVTCVKGRIESSDEEESSDNTATNVQDSDTFTVIRLENDDATIAIHEQETTATALSDLSDDEEEVVEQTLQPAVAAIIHTSEEQQLGKLQAGHDYNDLADPDTCILEDLEMDLAIACTENFFTIIARDVNEREIRHGGETFEVELTMKDSDVKTLGFVTDLNNGRYIASYFPITAGQYDLEVRLVDLQGDEREIFVLRGCPVTVTVIGSENDDCPEQISRDDDLDISEDLSETDQQQEGKQAVHTPDTSSTDITAVTQTPDTIGSPFTSEESVEHQSVRRKDSTIQLQIPRSTPRVTPIPLEKLQTENTEQKEAPRSTSRRAVWLSSRQSSRGNPTTKRTPRSALQPSTQEAPQTTPQIVPQLAPREANSRVTPTTPPELPDDAIELVVPEPADTQTEPIQIDAGPQKVSIETYTTMANIGFPRNDSAENKKNVDKSKALHFITFAITNLFVVGLFQAQPVVLQYVLVLLPNILSESITVFFLYSSLCKYLLSGMICLDWVFRNPLSRSVGWFLTMASILISGITTYITPGLLFGSLLGLIQEIMRIFYAANPRLVNYSFAFNIIMYALLFLLLMVLITGLLMGVICGNPRLYSFQYRTYVWLLTGMIVLFTAFSVYNMVKQTMSFVDTVKRRDFTSKPFDFYIMVFALAFIGFKIINFVHYAIAMILEGVNVLYIPLVLLLLPISIAIQATLIMLVMGNLGDKAWSSGRVDVQNIKAASEDESDQIEPLVFTDWSREKTTTVLLCAYREDFETIQRTVTSLIKINKCLQVFVIHDGYEGGEQTLEDIKFHTQITTLADYGDYVYGRKCIWQENNQPKLFHLISKKKNFGKLHSQLVMMHILDHHNRHFPEIVQHIPQQLSAVPDFVLFLDMDTVISREKTIIKMEDHLRAYQNCAAVCPHLVIRSDNGSGFLNYVITLQKTEMALSHSVFKRAEDAFDLVQCAPGACSVFRTQAILSVLKHYKKDGTPVGLMDICCRALGEDRYLCTLLLCKGYGIAYLNDKGASTDLFGDLDSFLYQRRRWVMSTVANQFFLLKKAYDTKWLADPQV